MNLLCNILQWRPLSEICIWHALPVTRGIQSHTAVRTTTAAVSIMASFQVTLHRVRKDSGQGEMVSCETSLLNSVD